jgi:hypothetical protein
MNQYLKIFAIMKDTILILINNKSSDPLRKKIEDALSYATSAYSYLKCNSDEEEFSNEEEEEWEISDEEEFSNQIQGAIDCFISARRESSEISCKDEILYEIIDEINEAFSDRVGSGELGDALLDEISDAIDNALSARIKSGEITYTLLDKINDEDEIRMMKHTQPSDQISDVISAQISNDDDDEPGRGKAR